MTSLIKMSLFNLADSVGRLPWPPVGRYREIVARLSHTRLIRRVLRFDESAACSCAGSDDPEGGARGGPPGWAPAAGEAHLSGVFLNRLLLGHVRRGDFASAEAEARWGLDLSREVVGAGHPSYAACVNNLALILLRRGELAGAESLLRPALSSYRDAPGSPSRGQATSLVILALAHELKGDLAWARRLYREGLDAYRFLGLDGQAGYADGLIALARVFWKQREWERSALLMGEAQAIQQRVLGERHPAHATTLIILACLSRKLGDLDDAETLLREALDLRRCAPGDSHPAYASCLHHLGLVLYEARDRVNADAALGAALAIRRNRLGEHHPLTVLTKTHLDKVACLLALDSQEFPAFPEELLDDERDPAPAFEPARGFEAGSMPGLGVAVSRPAPGDGPETGAGAGPPSETLPLTLPPPVPEAEADRGGPRDEETAPARRAALAVLSKVLSLAHRDAERSASLRECTSRAAALQDAILGCAARSLPPEAGRLAAGEHPLSDLVTLVERQKELDNLTWARLHASVASRFGNALATDVARGRIRLAGRPLAI